MEQFARHCAALEQGRGGAGPRRFMIAQGRALRPFGAVAGSVLTGSTAGTAAGAVIGGVIGRENTRGK